MAMTGRFSSLGDAELRHLLLELHQAPSTFEEEARVALNHAALERGLSINSVLEENRQTDRHIAAQMSLERDSKRRKRDRFYLIYGRVIGGLGLIVAVIVGVLSSSAGHIGGMVTAFGTAACSLWLMLRKS